jgi:bifunctional polynucleotide phosphatase/kinase
MSVRDLDETLKLYYYNRCATCPVYPKKILVIDLDWTIVKPKSRNIHPKDYKDWIWWDKTVIPTLRKYSDHYVVIITNQAGDKYKDDIEGTVSTIFSEILNVVEFEALDIYICFGNDIYRKPNTTVLENYVFKNVIPEKILCVGDAAGRVSDFSDSDRKLGSNILKLLRCVYDINIKVPFYTPEEFFLGNSRIEKNEWRGFDPVKFMKDRKNQKPVDILGIENALIILVGPPASGKSTLAKRFHKELDAYVISKDKMKSNEKKFQKELEENISEKIIVLDATNSSAANRRIYINMYGNRGKILCYYMNESRDLYKHINIYRERIGGKRIPDVAINTYYSKLDEPNMDEGFNEIINVEFIPKFKSKREFCMFVQRS